MPKILKEEERPEFIGQRPGEEVIIMLLKHWYTLVQPIAVALLIIVLSFAIPVWWGVLSYIFHYAITTLVYYLWLVFWVTRIVHSYAIWIRDQHVITTERIINMHQKGMFSREVSELELNRIQNITHSIKGPISTMLNFGTVTVQSAGANNIILHNIANPDSIQEEIARLVRDLPHESHIAPGDVSGFLNNRK